MNETELDVTSRKIVVDAKEFYKKIVEMSNKIYKSYPDNIVVDFGACIENELISVDEPKYRQVDDTWEVSKIGE